MIVRLLVVFLVAAIPRSEAQETQEETGYQYQEPEVVLQTLSEVLSRPEFERLVSEREEEEQEEPPEWLEGLVDWLADFLSRSGARTASTGLRGVEVFLYAMAAALVVAAIVFVLKSAAASRRERALQDERDARPRFGPGSAPGELPPDEYWRRALEHGERRRYKEAIREFLLGAMSSLERSGLVRARSGLTNRDYLRAARGDSRSSLTVLVSRFEHVYFGRREATPDGFRACREAFEKSFRSEIP